MDSIDLRLLALLAQLVGLDGIEAPEGVEHVGRITLRTATGRLVGEALLMEESLTALHDAVAGLNDRRRTDLSGDALLDQDEVDAEFAAMIDGDW